MLKQGAAVILDVVRSRTHADRSAVQRALSEAADAVNEVVPAERRLAPTVGDEMQGAYPDVRSALRAVLLIRLALEDPYDCRAGIGVGAWEPATDDATIVDGPAWWTAREAVDEAGRRQRGRQPGLRSWYRLAEGVEPSLDVWDEGIVNAYLSCRDEIVSSMNARQRRLAWGTLLGRTQTELADIEGISASAVSQNLRRSGAAGLIAASVSLESA